MSFLTPKAPSPQPLPPPPTPDNSASRLEDAARAERKAKGQAANILTGGQGLLTEPATASRVLLS